MPQQPVSAIVHLGVSGYLRQISAYQGEIMAVVELANTANSIQRALVTDMAPKGIGGVGGIDHYSALADNIHGLAHQARLGIIRMYLEKLTQG